MEFIDLLRYFGALLLVLAMVGGAGLLARRFGVPGVYVIRAVVDEGIQTRYVDFTVTVQGTAAK